MLAPPHKRNRDMTYLDTLGAIYEMTVWFALIASVWAISDKVWGSP
jgi:hypothetical protein